VFDRLSDGDWPAAVNLLHDDVHHVFPGDSSLGGERHSKDAAAEWFARFYRLFPGVRFEVQEVVSRGWPWSTWVAVSWVAYLEPADGEPYENAGSEWFHLRWGRVTYLREYVASHLVDEAVRQMALSGVDEAAAEPIAR
jgi:ketosteroid isomerase-like protein